MENQNLNTTNKKSIWSKVKVPHTLALIFMIMVFVAIATYFIPSGAYERVVDASGRNVVVPGSFHYVGSNPQGIMQVLQAPIKGLVAGAEIISFLFIVGGAFSLITRTKAIDFGIIRIVNILVKKNIII